jgi:ABC-type nitrate/sulfonate/bicarbonate transport system permease component
MGTNNKALQTLYGVAGLASFFALWQIIGLYQLAGLSWPPLTAVLAYLFDPDRHALFLRAIDATLRSTIAGYILGAVVGIALASVAYMLPRLQRGSDRFAAVINSIPSIALGPIFLILIEREATPAGVASIHVFFIVYVSMNSGLSSTTQAHEDLFTTLGSNNLKRFLRLNLPSAIPAIVSGLRLSWPAALIGAIIGEWFGAPRGIGILIINAMQNFQINLLWSAVLLAAMVSLFFFGLLTLLERAAYRRYR